MLRPITCALAIAGLLSACHAPVLSPSGPASVTADYQLTVVVRHQAARRVQAVLADVERLAVEVRTSFEEMSVKFIDKADFATGQTTLTFTGLKSPYGTVTVKALDLDGRVIGQAQSSTNFVHGQPIVVDLTVTLEPTYLTPAAPTGGLTPTITFHELPTVGTLAATHPIVGDALAVDSNGHPWVMTSSNLMRLSPTGTTLLTLPGSGRRAIAPDGAGHIWAGSSANLIKHGTDGTALVTKAFSATTLAVGEQDSVWAASGPRIRKLSAAGTVLWELDLGGIINHIAVDRQTGVGWLAHGSSYDNSTRLIRLSPDGVQLGETTLPTSGYTRLALDGAGEGWAIVTGNLMSAPLGRPVFRFDAGGGFVSSHEASITSNVSAFDDSGHAWVGSGSANANNLSRLDPQGARVGVNSIKGRIKDIARAPNGDMWVLSDGFLTKLVP